MFKLKSTLIILIIIIKLLINKIETTICPPRDQILPCKCADYFNLIECTNIQNDYQLKNIFTIIKNELNKQQSRLIYDELKLVQTNLEYLGKIDNIFSDISFRRISISRNNLLKTIETNAFSSSFNITTEIMIEDNELLGKNYDDNVKLFKCINQFTALNTLHLNDNGIKFIPENAFSHTQPALRELFLNDNRIEFIDNNAFIGLTTIELINLDGNYLNKLSLYSFNMKNTTNNNNLLRIFLRSNKLQTDSFPSGIFTHLERKIYLNLNINNISTIEQNVFQSFFKRHSILSISKNPLKCTDCDFKWLYDQGIINDDKSLKNQEHLLRDYQCIDHDNDNNNNKIIDHLNKCPESILSKTIEQCVNEAINKEQELYCLNSNQHNIHINHYLYIFILIILINFFLIN